MSNLTAALNQLEFARKMGKKEMILHSEILVCHFEKEDEEAFESDLEAFEARSEFHEALVLGGAMA